MDFDSDKGSVGMKMWRLPRCAEYGTGLLVLYQHKFCYLTTLSHVPQSTAPNHEDFFVHHLYYYCGQGSDSNRRNLKK